LADSNILSHKFLFDEEKSNWMLFIGDFQPMRLTWTSQWLIQRSADLDSNQALAISKTNLEVTCPTTVALTMDRFA
jgi:hypothetical protein